MVNDMSEQVRCPMCGKPNPADAEVCRYCHARLKPLRPGEAPQPLGTAELQKDLPDWMRQIQEDAPSEDEAQDILQALREESEAVLPETPATEDEDLWAAMGDEEEELPDWLKSLGEEPAGASPAASAEAAPEPTEPEAAAPAGADDLPDWLDTLGAPEPAEPEAAAPAERADDLPDWLDTLGAPEATEPEAAAPAERADDLPDWLSEAAPAGAPEPAEPEAAAPAERADLPDWLAALETAAQESSGEASADEAREAEAPSDETEAAPKPFVFEGAEDLDELLAETPDWLNWLSPEEAEEIESDDRALLPPSTETEAEAEEEAPVLQGELPSWLEAMRPITAASPGAVAGDEPLETQGPLAGLRGVITPPESTFMKPGKVALVGGRLVLTEQQEAQVEALKTLLDEEFNPQPPPKPGLISQQQVLRWLIGGLLLLAALLPLLVPPLRPALPSKILPAALNAQRLVEKVPENAPVLLAVDYSPGFTSEMETAAAPLLSDLLAKNVRLIVVSTQPTGPDLSAHLLSQALAWQGVPGENYLNLGYLPGGTAGLYAFAHAPQMVFRRGAGIDDIWQTPALASVQRLADFAMVVVVTEDAETARAWVEQVRPVLDEDTPLVMVISTQAEPMVEPYYETASHQVHGLVTGLEGGLAYAALRGQTISEATHGQWGSYSYIVWVAVVLMVLAGIYNLALGWREARTAPPADEEEEA